jgi:Mrp family chromosome partitioning ATPase
VGGKQVAIVGAPGLVRPITDAGYRLVVEATEPEAVAAAAKVAAASGVPYVVIVGERSEQVMAWARAQTSKRVPVLFLSPGPEEPPISATRTIALPASVNDIMGMFKAPAVDGADTPISFEDAVAEPIAVPKQAAEPDSVPAADPPAPPAPVRPMPPEPDSVPAADPPDPPAPVRPMPPEPDSVPAADPPAPPAPVRPMPPEPDSVPAADPPAPPSYAPPPPIPPTYVAPPPVPVPAVEPTAQVQPIRHDPSVPVLPTTPVLPDPVAERGSGRLAPVVVVFAGKGGVGKTSTALATAHRAVNVGRIERVIAVDANRGQGDFAAYLRVRDAHLPSVYDVAMGAEPRSAIVTPDALAAARGGRLADLGFGVVLAPNHDQANPALVTTSVYQQVIDLARRVADLVIVDTQIVESYDTTGLIDELVKPLLAGQNGWGLAISDSSTPATDNVKDRIRRFFEFGVTRDRLMFLFNRIDPSVSVDQAIFEPVVRQYAQLVGVVPEESQTGSFINGGGMPADDSPLAEAIDRVLARVTGLQAFDRASVQPASRKRGLFSRRR